MTTSYVSGQMVTSTAAFVNKAGAAADPDTVTLKYKKGSGSVTTVAYPSAPVVRDATGAYHADLDTSGWAGPDSQLWTLQWTGTGAVQTLGADYWEITPPALP